MRAGSDGLVGRLPMARAFPPVGSGRRRSLLRWGHHLLYGSAVTRPGTPGALNLGPAPGRFLRGSGQLRGALRCHPLAGPLPRTERGRFAARRRALCSGRSCSRRRPARREQSPQLQSRRCRPGAWSGHASAGITPLAGELSLILHLGLTATRCHRDEARLRHATTAPHQLGGLPPLTGGTARWLSTRARSNFS